MGFVHESVTVDDGDTVYPALVLDDQRWNGWLIPFFDTTTAQKMVRDFTALAEADSMAAEYMPKLSWDGVTLIVAQYDDEDGPQRIDPRVLLDGDTETARYCIGGWEWCWMRANI